MIFCTREYNLFQVFPLVTIINIYINPPLSLGGYFIKENRKADNQKLHKNLQLKDKKSTPSSKDITSSLVSTKVDDPEIQSKEK